MFDPIPTRRLFLRPVRGDDVDALVERRSDPDVARWQSWPAPYPRQSAVGLVESLAATPEPIDDSWWMITIADGDDSVVYGDLALRFSNDGRTAEVGYTLARTAWGNGFATEALEGLLAWLFDSRGVTRVAAMLHPDNLRSARVLERCGFEFEGHTRNSYWSGDENSDDWIYGLTPELRAQWAERPQQRPEIIELVEPYPTGLRHVISLQVHHSQAEFVAPISVSLAQVAVPPIDEGEELKPWPRIVHADGEPVGFVMLAEPTATSPTPLLWRLLIDGRHQRRGIGSAVVDMVIEQARSWGATPSWCRGFPAWGRQSRCICRRGLCRRARSMTGRSWQSSRLPSSRQRRRSTCMWPALVRLITSYTPAARRQ